MTPTKPQEGLFHLHQDLWETNNLANQPEYAQIKQQLRAELDNWRQMVKAEGVSNQLRQGG